jgi:hypothetical protein
MSLIRFSSHSKIDFVVFSSLPYQANLEVIVGIGLSKAKRFIPAMNYSGLTVL